MTREEVFAAYEAVREFLPQMPEGRDPSMIRQDENLNALVDEFDVFIFDGFGVLNRGDAALGRSIEVIQHLRETGKKIFVMTNAASAPKPGLVLKYRRMGFDFEAEEIVSSRDVVLSILPRHDSEMTWGLIAPDIEHFDLKIKFIRQGEEGFDEADGFLFLSTLAWDEEHQQALIENLKAKPRPMILGNPDMIAPHADHMTIEPGAYTLTLRDQISDLECCGKPFPSIFALTDQRLQALSPDQEIDKQRVLMLGDTLHTDILGAASYGYQTALLTNEGFFRSLEWLPFVEKSGIVPNFALSAL